MALRQANLIVKFCTSLQIDFSVSMNYYNGLGLVTVLVLYLFFLLVFESLVGKRTSMDSYWSSGLVQSLEVRQRTK